MAAKRNSPRKERDIRRKVGVRPVKKSFLIVCEGQNTEPDYFNSFRLTSATVKAVGKGLGTRVLVKEAVGIRQASHRRCTICCSRKWTRLFPMRKRSLPASMKVRLRRKQSRRQQCSLLPSSCGSICDIPVYLWPK